MSGTTTASSHEGVRKPHSPFVVEYAKSSRSQCQKCKKMIGQGQMRIGRMVQSETFDGFIPLQHHVECLLVAGSGLVISTVLCDGFLKLRPADQQTLKEMIHASSTAPSESDGPSKKRKYSELPQQDQDEKSSKKVKLVDEAQGSWETMKVAQLKDACSREGLSKTGTKSQLLERLKSNVVTGTSTATLLGGAEPIRFSDSVTVTNPCETTSSDRAQSPHEVALDEENRHLWEIKDALGSCSISVLKDMLALNNQNNSGGMDVLLDRCADGLFYGALPACPECKEQKLVFRDGRYQCSGFTEWSKCLFAADDVARTPWQGSTNTNHAFLSTFKFVLHQKPLAAHASVAAMSRQVQQQLDKDAQDKETKNQIAQEQTLQNQRMLCGVRIGCIGKSSRPKKFVQSTIEQCGAQFCGQSVDNAQLLLASKTARDAPSDSVRKALDLARSLHVPVLLDEWLFQSLDKGSLVDFDGFLVHSDSSVLQNLECVKRSVSVSVTTTAASVAADSAVNENKSQEVKRKTLKVKQGCVVMEESGLGEVAHVLVDGKDVYDVVLNLTDITSGVNSYYMLQLIEHDCLSQWYLFRKYGRIGTKIGGSKLEEFATRDKAQKHFRSLYLDKTGNRWFDRNEMVKHPGKFYPVQVDYSSVATTEQLIGTPDGNWTKSGSSRLPVQVQQLIRTLFDVKQMQRTLLEMEIDIKKMPLGRLSSEHIKKGYAVLSELHRAITKSSTPSESELVQLSNHFYCLLPHDFGQKAPPIIRTLEQVNDKTALVTNLLELEVASHILSSADASVEDPLDAYYRKLETNIVPLEQDKEEWSMIQKYTQNTHASTHRYYNLQLMHAFAIDRNGEGDRFQDFSKLHNRQLLWHGSRTTNFVGILSQGLRIAPPTAAVSGYMFGKGIYTADSVSKSANYVNASRDHPIGFLLLCEVALGNMYECQHAQYMDRPPSGYHSTKGCGQTAPDPNASKLLPDGCLVPLGTLKDGNGRYSSLLYNEMIVYDPAQVRIRYLVQVKFDYI